jgi:hypothetical protein
MSSSTPVEKEQLTWIKNKYMKWRTWSNVMISSSVGKPIVIGDLIDDPTTVAGLCVGRSGRRMNGEGGGGICRSPESDRIQFPIIIPVLGLEMGGGAGFHRS